mmetsp:Transcript_13459/g.18612  ORF Transcript_13459/g.18612 Transcript_13459/m.18612 type:complete len:80 (+) Transcript_13459:620-859(+)
MCVAKKDSLLPLSLPSSPYIVLPGVALAPKSSILKASLASTSAARMRDSRPGSAATAFSTASSRPAKTSSEDTRSEKSL